MDRFQNGDGGLPEGPLALIQIDAFSIEAHVVEEKWQYTLSMSDSERGYVDVITNSTGIAQLVYALSKAAISSCDESFLTMLMVMMTETPEESVEKLFESGHAKDNLEG